MIVFTGLGSSVFYFRGEAAWGLFVALYTKEELEALSEAQLAHLCVVVAESRSGFLSVEVDHARVLVDEWAGLVAMADEAPAGALRPEIERLRRRMVSFLDSVGLRKG